MPQWNLTVERGWVCSGKVAKGTGGLGIRRGHSLTSKTNFTCLKCWPNSSFTWRKREGSVSFLFLYIPGPHHHLFPRPSTKLVGAFNKQFSYIKLNGFPWSNLEMKPYLLMQFLCKKFTLSANLSNIGVYWWFCFWLFCFLTFKCTHC